MTLRPAASRDAGAVADVWERGWHDGHDGGVPEELVAARSRESFASRAAARVDDTTVAVVDGGIAGFVMVAADEVEQVYVDRAHRGSGVAAALLGAAERRVAANGHERAWLAVVATNLRARRFYERCGWTDTGLVEYAAAGSDGPVTIPAHRYEKRVAPTADRRR